MAVAFDPPISTSGQVLCQSGGRAGSQPNSESIRVVMAFCLSDRPLVSIEGKLNRRAGAGDAAFVSLIRDMTRRMFETAPPKTP